MARQNPIIVPDILYEGQNLFQLNAAPNLPKYTSGFINSVNGWAGGSKPENVSQVSELIKKFREENPYGTLKDWKNYHHSLEGKDIEVFKGRGLKMKPKIVQMAGIEQGVRDIMAKMEEVKNNISQLTEENVRAWLENLVYEKTYCGLEAQRLILKKIAEKRCYDWILGSVEDEKQGIDGYIVDPNGPKFYPLQIKSSSYGNKHKQEHFVCPVVTYDLKEEGINYNMPDNALVEPLDSEIWTTIKQRALKRYCNSHPEA